MTANGGRRTTVRALTLVAAAAMAASMSACALLRGDPVAMVGDSITVLIGDDLDGGVADWKVEAVIGATAAEMVPAGEGLASDSPTQAVLNLGTNDALTQVPAQDAVAALDTLVGAFDGTDCTHLVTLSTVLPDEGSPPAPQTATAINEWIRARADADDRLRIVDWNARLVGEGGAELLEDDRIHPNETGQAELAAMIEQSVGSC